MGATFSTLAYQGCGRGLDLDELRAINDWATGHRWPDLVVLLDVDVDVMAARLAKRELDRFERAGDEFHRRVVDGFRTAYADLSPGRGSAEAIGGSVFRNWVLPFEALSVLLLAALIGAIVLSRTDIRGR